MRNCGLGRLSSGKTSLGLSNHQLETILKHEPNFRGVFASDTLPASLRPLECGIVNLASITSGGTHWVCYYNHPSWKCVEFFDSFGFSPNMAIRNYLKTKPIIYNQQQFQKLQSDRCALYCIYFIRMRNRGFSYHAILNTFKQKPDCFNEYLVSRHTV